MKSPSTDTEITRRVLGVVCLLAAYLASNPRALHAQDTTAPTITSTPVTEAVIGRKYSYTVTAEDPDGDELTFSANQLPGWLTFVDHGDGTATLSGTPRGRDRDNGDDDDWDDDDDDDGDDDDWDDSWWWPGKTFESEVELAVTDGEDEAEQTFHITVTTPGGGPPGDGSDDDDRNDGDADEDDSDDDGSSEDPPGGGNSDGGSDDGGSADDGSGDDSNGENADDDNGSGGEGPGGGDSDDGSDGDSGQDESGGWNDDDPGGGSDDGNESGDNDTGTGVNQAPEADDDAGTTLEDAAIRLTILANDSDPDGDELSVGEVTSADHGSVSLNSNGSVRYEPDTDYFGEDSFTYTVEDDQGASDEAAVELAVQPVNDPPHFSPGENLEVASTAGPQTVDRWASSIHPGAPNESGQDLTFDVSVDSPGLFARPPSVDADTGDLTFAPAESGDGAAQVTILLRDSGGTENGGENTSESVTFTIEVTAPNRPPRFTSTPHTSATAGEPYSYRAAASDPDDEALTITAASVPGWVSFSDNDDGTGSLEGTPGQAHVGEHRVVLRASDGEHTAEQSFSITVSAGNSAPKISLIDDQETTMNAPVELTNISVSDEESSTDELTVTVRSSNQSLLPDRNISLTENGGEYTVALVPASNETGTAEVTLTVSDGELENQAQFRLRVVPDNSRPEHPPAIGISEGASITIEGDPSNTFLIDWGGRYTGTGGQTTYTWKLASTPSFSDVLMRRPTGRAPYVELAYESLDSLLAARDVRVNETIELYHRIDRTTDGATTAGEAYRISITRGHVGSSSLPETFLLRQNYPNPFNPSTTIEYGLPEQSHVRLVVYDAVGQRVAVLVDEVKEPGWYRTVWDAGGNRSGPYFYQLQTGEVVRTKKLLFLK